MTGGNRLRQQRLLREAEGYLELGLARPALATLERLGDPGPHRGRFAYYTGEAMRMLERYDEAVGPLELAAEFSPSDTRIWLALGWCYKRLRQIDRSIDALERALDVEPQSPLIHYNLACYLSLAGRRDSALDRLAKAISLDPTYRDLVRTESDFDGLRNDPGFQSLTAVPV